MWRHLINLYLSCSESVFKQSRKSHIATLCLGLLLSLGSPIRQVQASNLASLVENAKTAFANNQFQKVVDLLTPLELEHGGIAEFDYYLGTAFLETNRYGEAVFLLSRAIAVKPDFAGARFELARAEFLSNNFEAAKKEFQIVLQSNPPEKVADMSREFLQMIKYKTASYSAVHMPKIGLRFGSDSNAANGHEGEVYDDLFDNINFQIDDSSYETESNYYSLLVSDSYLKPLTDTLKWSILGNGYVRKNPDADFVDLRVLSAASGIEWQLNRNKFAASLGYLHATIAGEEEGANQDYQDLSKKAWLMDFSYRLQLQNKDSFGAALKTGFFRHDDVLAIKDVDRYDVEVSYSTTLFDDWMVNLSGFFGNDRADGSNKLYETDRQGLEANLIHPIANNMLVSTKLKYEKIDYQDDQPFVSIVDDNFVTVVREDEKLLAELALTWFRDMNWSNGLKFLYIDNQSSSIFYDYDKTVIEFAVNYQF